MPVVITIAGGKPRMRLIDSARLFISDITAKGTPQKPRMNLMNSERSAGASYPAVAGAFGQRFCRYPTRETRAFHFSPYSQTTWSPTQPTKPAKPLSEYTPGDGLSGFAGFVGASATAQGVVHVAYRIIRCLPLSARRVLWPPCKLNRQNLPLFAGRWFCRFCRFHWRLS